jgi:hypothetical protein
MRIHFPELIQFKAPSGLTAQLTVIAERESSSVSAVLRRLVLEQLERAAVKQSERSSRMAAYDGPRGLVVA